MSTRWMPLIAGIALFAVLFAASYFSQGGGVATNVFTAAITMPSAEHKRFVPYGSKEYRNTAYRFSLLYPGELEVKEYIEGGNALTVTFQNAKKGTGFQLFIVPYEGAQISDERFRQDVPSGVRADLAAVTVDGATGAAFYSENAALGGTRELWFIHNGFLFEVTTPQSLAAWLAGIMQTWKFL